MNEDELIQLNYKKPKRLELIRFLNRKVVFELGYGKLVNGIITEVRRNWEGKERIKITQDDPSPHRITVEFSTQEFRRAIENGKMRIL